MQIYILKNNQSQGPFEETKVLEMLRNGQLSANDQAVRQGENQWQPLGNLFPNAAGSAVNNAAPLANLTASGSNQKGCRRIFGTALLVLGILLFLGNSAALIISLVLPQPSICELADERIKEFNEAAAKNPKDSEEIESNRTLMNSAVKSCGEALDYYRRWRFIFGGLIFFGLVMALAGFFLRR